MNRGDSGRRFVVAAMLVALGLLATATELSAREQTGPSILPVNQPAYGLTYGEWSARWWQWAFALPIDRHPLYDTADCSAGQSGPVWFLGGAFTATETPTGELVVIRQRACTVPAGVALLVPIINTEASTIEGNGQTAAELAAAARGFQDLARKMSCTIDGVEIEDLDDAYRVVSPAFTFGPLPRNNVLQDIYKDKRAYPAGATSLAVADGVYVLLEPLAPGQHTIHFHGEVPAFKFLLDITYQITVTG